MAPRQRVQRNAIEARLRFRSYAQRTVYTHRRRRHSSIDGISTASSNRQSSGYSAKSYNIKTRSLSGVKPAAPHQKSIQSSGALKPSATSLPSSSGLHHNQKTAMPTRNPRVSTPNAQSLDRHGSIDLYESRKPYSKKKNSLQVYVLSFAAAIVAFLGVAASLNTFFVNHQVGEQVAVLSQATEGAELDIDRDVPDESEPDESTLQDYNVAAEMPRFIRIPKIGIENRIISVGVNANNQLAAPANIFDAGWYRGSALPGERGTALIDGHVSGPTKPGVFKNIKDLNMGDTIEVERGNGEIVTYEVTDKKSYPYDQTDMKAALKSSEPGRNALNLITCDGPFNAQDNNYEERLIVFAVER